MDCTTLSKNIAILTLFILATPLSVDAQFSFGWNIYKDDSIRVTKYRGTHLIKTVGTYTNGQEKYIRFTDFNQIQDTVNYFSRNGNLTSQVRYDSLAYHLVDSTHLENYTFIDSCYEVVKRQIVKSFPKLNVFEYFEPDFSNSDQRSPVYNRYKMHCTKLYEPVNYDLSQCRIVFHTIPDKHAAIQHRYLFSARVDSTFKIVQCELNLDKEYELNYGSKHAESIMHKYNFKKQISSDKIKGINIIGPYLEMRNKQFYWIIRRRAGKFIATVNLDHMINDAYVEEIEINVETGEHQKRMKFLGPIHCY